MKTHESDFYDEEERYQRDRDKNDSSAKREGTYNVFSSLNHLNIKLRELMMPLFFTYMNKFSPPGGLSGPPSSWPTFWGSQKYPSQNTSFLFLAICAQLGAKFSKSLAFFD